MKFIDGCSYLGSYKHSEIVCKFINDLLQRNCRKNLHCSEIKQSKGLIRTLFFFSLRAVVNVCL